MSGSGEDQWKNATARVELSDQGESKVWVQCPRCGQPHAVDTLEEKLEMWLYCDADKVKVSFPKSLGDRIRDELRKTKVLLATSDAGGPLAIRIDPKTGAKSAQFTIRF